MKKRHITILMTIAVLVFSFSSCAAAETKTEAVETSTEITTAQTQAVSVDTSDLEALYTISDAASYSDEDTDADYDESSAVTIALADGKTEIDGEGALVDGNVVTISGAGTYIVSGQLTDGQLVVSTDKEDLVRLVLNNAEISNNDGSALWVEQAEKTIITLAQNSVNQMSDGEVYSDESEDATDAAIFSADDLTINGTGQLKVTANFQHAIKSVDELVITGGVFDITAAKDGLRGKDDIAILEGDFAIKAGGAGIKSTNDEDADKGWVSIDGGTFDIVSEDNGIQAQSTLMISAGDISVNAAQDTLHSNTYIQVMGGDLNLTAGDDGAHADDTLYVADGTIVINDSYEGLEGAIVIIDGGNITLKADDDGINAAGGNDGDMGPGDQFSTKEGYYVVVNNGDVYVSAQGDGVDSNGDIYITGGTLVVDGPTSGGNSAMDMERGNFAVSGGTLIASGSSGMLVNPTEASQPVITVVFSSEQQSGSLVTLTDEDGNALFTVDPEKTYQSVMISSPELAQGDTVGIQFGGQYSGDASGHSYYMNGNVSEAASTIRLQISNMIMTIDENGNETQISGAFGGGGGQGVSGDGGRHQGDMPQMGDRPQDGGFAPPQ